MCSLQATYWSHMHISLVKYLATLHPQTISRPAPTQYAVEHSEISAIMREGIGIASR
jgi:hypothetical protein